MNVEEAILKRRSVRSYTDEKIPRQTIQKIMDAVRMAPSANNRQDWKFVIVEDEKVKEEVYRAARRQSFVKEAPAVIAAVATDPGRIMTCGIPGGIVDVSIALDHLTLKACEEGLGTCWIGAFDQEKARRALGIPDQYKIVALMPIGYPKQSLEKQTKPRKNLPEIMCFNHFSK